MMCELAENEQFYTSEAMRKFGGSFVKSLGTALRSADMINASKIKQAFPEYWNKYYKLGIAMYEGDK